MTISLNRLEANRRNAQLSTGPRTLSGKAHSSKNARKHGMWSSEVVITEGPGKEDPKEYARLLAAMHDYFVPVGPMEEMLVEEIVNYCWRQRRVRRTETARLQNYIGASRSALYFERHNSFQMNKHLLERLAMELELDAEAHLSHTETRAYELENARQQLRQSTLGIDFLLEVLQSAEAWLVAGSMDPLFDRRMDSFFGGDYDQLGSQWAWLGSWWCTERRMASNKEAGEDKEREKEHTQAGERLRAELGTSLQEEQRRLVSLRKQVLDRENEEDATLLGRCSMLPAKELNQILRCEAFFSRELHRTLDQLERLQRQRRGEAVPPPLRASVTLDNGG